MNIKMIVSDLDATLLTDDKRITDKTKNVIEKCQSLGIKFVPATARVLEILEILGVKDYFSDHTVVCGNGCRIYEKGYVEIAHQGMSKKELDSFLPDLVSQFGHLRITVDMNGFMYVNHNLSEVDPHAKDYQITDLKNLPNIMVDRVFIGLSSREQLQEVRKILPDYIYAHLIEESSICRILHKNVSKAQAIHFLCERYQISLDEVVVFGDDYNDIEMFEIAGTKIAMSNAIPELKQMATEITKSNNEDGVAYWLEKNILDKHYK